MKRPIEIIAEIGINHLGQNELIRQMIYEAADCGADTVKFQLYDPAKVFGPREGGVPEHFSSQEWEAIHEARLTRRQLFWIQQECERAKVEFLSSVSDLSRLEWLKEIKVERFKIASDDAMNEELCRAILSLGKPTLVSDGHIRQLEEKPKYFTMKQYQSKIKWLYCISKYPTSLDELEFLDNFKSVFVEGFNDMISWPADYHGFSDHTQGITAAVVAMSLGARIIEKHFTLDQTLPGPDHICSADPIDLRELCKMRNEVEAILYGSP